MEASGAGLETLQSRATSACVNDRPAPSPNDEYLLYQTLVGAWPSEPLNDTDDWKTFCERIENYMLKAIREAKQTHQLDQSKY